MEELKLTVSNYFSVFEQMRALAAETKDKRVPLRERACALENDILSFMDRNELDVLNFGDRKLELKSLSRKHPISKKNLPALLGQYFKSSVEADKCMEFLIDAAGTTEVRALRRGKVAAKRSKKQKTAQSVSEMPASPSDDDDDDDDEE